MCGGGYFFTQVLRSSGPRRDKKPNFLEKRPKVRFTGWTKLGWNYFIVTYHRVKNSKYVIFRYLKNCENFFFNTPPHHRVK